MNGKIEAYLKDPSWPDVPKPDRIFLAGELIDGVIVEPILPNTDMRGSLYELLTTRDESIEPIVHSYAVLAEAGSTRDLVYHAKQTDRLHFVQGKFRIILMDIRKESPTFGGKIRFETGVKTPYRVHIPPFVAHAVRNIGNEAALFINMPTRPFLRKDPDKFRLNNDADYKVMEFDGLLDF